MRKRLSSEEDCVCPRVGTSRAVLLCCLARRAASRRGRGYTLLRKWYERKRTLVSNSDSRVQILLMQRKWL